MQPLVVVVHSRCVVWFFARYVLLLAKCLLHVAKSINIYYPTQRQRERGRAMGREQGRMNLKFIQHAMQMKWQNSNVTAMRSVLIPFKYHRNATI